MGNYRQNRPEECAQVPEKALQLKSAALVVLISFY
jgi:hypothetical protein